MKIKPGNIAMVLFLLAIVALVVWYVAGERLVDVPQERLP